MGDEELGLLARNLGDLARVNETFEQSQGGRAAFNRWAPVAQSLLTMLEGMTDSRLPPAPPGDAPPPSSRPS